jgi:leucyl aminopeptidase
MTLSFATNPARAIPLHVLREADLPGWLKGQSDTSRDWIATNGFRAGKGQALLVPSADGSVAMALAGIGNDTDRMRIRFRLAAAAAALPEAAYRIETGPSGDVLETEALGWLLGQYRFERYRKSPRQPASLLAPGGIDSARVELIASSEALTRDLINTPASDMGPTALEAAATELAEAHGGTIAIHRGDELLAGNFPMIHAVGRAAAEVPRLIDMRWGDVGPTLTLVGKGVCFDTGGLDLKPAASMGLMKKDMGGAAAVLGLARMIMSLNLPLRLRVLIPAVENAVSAASYRPQDILTARNGLTVEINNTDAEGRVVLADALACAAEEAPDLIVSMATLTGAARVAVGPDLAPFYATGDTDAAAVAGAAARVADPVWRMPFHDPYEPLLEPGIADLDNAPKGGFAGSITAALFLRRFVAGQRYLHFDIYGWQPTPAPARPKGGIGQGTRALLDALPSLLGL